MTKKCPVCLTTEGVREFIYGLPAEEPDSNKYVLGGCDFSDNMPDYRCVVCATDFYRNSDSFQNNFRSNINSKYFQCKKCDELIESIQEIDWHECQ